MKKERLATPAFLGCIRSPIGDLNLWKSFIKIRDLNFPPPLQRKWDLQSGSWEISISLWGQNSRTNPKKKRKEGDFILGKRGDFPCTMPPSWSLFKGVKIGRLGFTCFCVCVERKSEIRNIFFSSGPGMYIFLLRLNIAFLLGATATPENMQRGREFQSRVVMNWWGLLWNLSCKVQISESEKREFSKGKGRPSCETYFISLKQNRVCKS